MNNRFDRGDVVLIYDKEVPSFYRIRYIFQNISALSGYAVIRSTRNPFVREDKTIKLNKLIALPLTRRVLIEKH